MNPSQNNNDQQFDKLSPVLELMYLMVTNMQKYLKVYTEDTSLENLQEYKDVYKALEHTKSVMDKVYGLDAVDEDMSETQTKAAPMPSQMPSMPAPQQKPAQDDFDFALDELRQTRDEVMNTSEQKPVAPVMPPVQHTEEPMPSVPTFQSAATSLPQQPQAPAIPVAPSMPAVENLPTPEMPAQQPTANNQNTQPAGQQNEIDSILAELRKLQQNNNPPQQ